MPLTGHAVERAESGTYPPPVETDAPAWTCTECGDAVSGCSECLHVHDYYDHVGPHEHMCVWCVRSDYTNDPLGQGPYNR